MTCLVVTTLESQVTNNRESCIKSSVIAKSHQVPTPAQQHEGTPAINRQLKPLRVPTIDGNKVKFEEFWSLFQSLVDASNEPVNFKMARLQQSLVGRAHEAIRGLGASAPEYEEAKKFLRQSSVVNVAKLELIWTS